MYYVIIINYGIVLLYTIRANGTVVAGALSARGVGAVMTSILLPRSPPAGSREFPFFSLTVLKLAARANANDITKVPRYGKPVHTVTLVRSDVLERAASSIAAELLQCKYC